MNHTIDCKWEENMTFNADVNGHSITLDATNEFGGDDNGPRPKPLLLLSLAGCTGMDVVSILKKMKVNIGGLNVKVTGELTDENPKYYKSIHIRYEVTGKDVLQKKVETAVKLSQETYCGVSALLKKACDLSYEIVYL